MLPHKALPHDFEEDIFINYSHVDNATVDEEELKGFVDKVHERLALRLRQLTGEEPKIWRDVLLEGTSQLKETIIIRLSKTVFLVCVLSPSYVNSAWCRDELNCFYEWASKNIGIKINNRSRIFKVVKTPIGKDPASDPFKDCELHDELRKVLQESLGYEFFEYDKLTGRLREFSKDFGDEYNRKHFLKVEDLAQDIVTFIMDQEFQKTKEKCVYLAETTTEFSNERNEIRRNLLQHGYTVLPDESLPFEPAAFDEKVTEYLKRCTLSIHLVGSDHVTITPDKDESQQDFEQRRTVFELQYKLFAARVQEQHKLAMIRGENDPEYSRLIWMPVGLNQQEDVNEKFLAYLQNDPAVQENAEILTGAKLEDLKTIIERKLNITWQQTSLDVKSKRVYLYCDKKDKDVVAPLKTFLQKRNHEVLLSFSDSGAPVSHAENIRMCDAILVVYGSFNTMEYKLPELRRINVNRLTRPLLAHGIYVSGPETDHKKTFTSDETLVMKSFGDFSEESLKPFLDRLEANP